MSTIPPVISWIITLIAAIKSTEKDFFACSRIIIGWRKKNRAVVRDERLKLNYWKVNFWHWCLTYAVVGTILITVLQAIIKNWLFALFIFGIGALVCGLFLFMRHKRWVDFHSEKEELGVIPERGKDAFKEAKKEMEDCRMSRIQSFLPFYIILSVILTALSVLIFTMNEMITGIPVFLYAAIFIYITVKIIYFKNKRDN
jgi:hypothetical protein